MKTICLHNHSKDNRKFSNKFIHLLKDRNYDVNIGDRYDSDLVISILCPEDDILSNFTPGTKLFSMLHYKTHMQRSLFLNSRGVILFSMDSVVDTGRRLIESYSPAIKYIIKILKKMVDVKNLNVLILGNGYASEIFQGYLKKCNIIVANRHVTSNYEYLKFLLNKTDILIDTMNRTNFNEFIISDEIFRSMSDDSIIVDFSYEGFIEGLPRGTIDNFIFTHKNKIIISCNSFPSLIPKRSMKIYENQILPFIDIIMRYDGDFNSLGEPLMRSNFDYYLKQLPNYV